MWCQRPWSGRHNLRSHLPKGGGKPRKVLRDQMGGRLHCSPQASRRATAAAVLRFSGGCGAFTALLVWVHGRYTLTRCEFHALGSGTAVFSRLHIHRLSFISTPRTPDRRTHRCKFNTARGPLDPLTTPYSTVLDHSHMQIRMARTARSRSRPCRSPPRSSDKTRRAASMPRTPPLHPCATNSRCGWLPIDRADAL